MPNWDPRAMEVLNCLERAGHQAVLVGGCVRDYLLGQVPHDYDMATSALPGEVARACAGLRVAETGVRHGTVTVLCQGLPVEVTTFRREGSYSDHRHPDRVDFTTRLEEDLARRDFTVNAMAWGREGLVDLFGGREDLKTGTIRCVGEGDRRFQEDALRILRGARFAAQLRFTVEGETADAMERQAPLLDCVSRERVAAEFVKLLCAPGAGEVLLAFPHIVTRIIPELAPAVGFDQRTPWHCWDVYTHIVKVVEQTPPAPALRLAALLHDVGKPACYTQDEQGVGHFYGHPKVSAAMADEILRRLRLDNATRERVVRLVKYHDLRLEPELPVVRRWLSRMGPELFFQWLSLARADCRGQAPIAWERQEKYDQVEEMARRLLEERACLTRKDLAVDGRDAMAAGLSGPQVGRVLRSLLEEVLQGQLPNRREELLSRLKILAEERNKS